MFIGHYAPAFVAAAHPKAPGLGALFVAGQFVDFGFMALALGGVERFSVVPGIMELSALDLEYMPFTHSLIGNIIWAAVFAAIVWLFTRNKSGALIAGLLGGTVVLSHWFLDVLVHRPDMTLLGTPPKLGLALWDVPWVEIPLELGITFAALYYYAVKTRGVGGNHRRIMILGAVLLALQIYSWLSHPEEGTADIFAATGLLAFTALAALAWWAGRNRTHVAA